MQKFNYLKSLLKGEAAQLIKGLELSSDSYKKAIEMLKNRYGSERRQRRAHIRAILESKILNDKDMNF